MKKLNIYLEAYLLNRNAETIYFNQYYHYFFVFVRIEL